MNKIKCLILPLIALAITTLTACSETEYPTFDTSISDIYFLKDSSHYSFGLNPPSVSEKTINLPVRIIGEKSENPREFSIEIIKDKTTAEANNH